MKLFPPNVGLDSLVALDAPTPPESLLANLQSRDSLDDDDRRGACEAELQTRLYLYDIVSSKDTSTLPDFVVRELQTNRILCLALLLHVQWRMRPTGYLSGVAKKLISEELEGVPVEIGKFIGDQLIHLLLGAPERAVIDQLTEEPETFHLTPQGKRLVALAGIVADFDAQQPQATISGLRSLITIEDSAGAASLLLLARLYQHLSLPYEEKESYSQWAICLSKISTKKLADLPGAICRSNPAMERSILDGVDRWLHLLKAGGAQRQVDETIDEFRKAGYATEFESLRVDTARQPGYDCRLVSRDEAGRSTDMQALVSGLLTSSARQGACLILRDETVSDVEKLPSAANPQELLARLPEHLQAASVMVLPELIEENALQSRKWIVCFDQSRPMDALGIGLVATAAEVSAIFARAILFETKLDAGKNHGWLQNATRLLAQPFDGQKQGLIRDAVRKVSEQISAGQSPVQVIEL